jgi:mitotic spindle assembly checkpoint protein MAD1
MDDDIQKILQGELSTLRREHSALQQTHADTLDDLSTLQRTSSSQISQQASQLAILQSQLSHLQHSLQSTESHAASLEEHLSELQSQNDDLQSQLSNLQSAQRDTSGSEILRKELSNQANQTRLLEQRLHKADSELMKLRAHAASIGVLEEKLRSAESRAIGVQSLRDEVARLQAEVDGLQDQRQKELDMSISMMDDENSLSKLRHDNARLLDELSATRSELSGTQASLITLETTVGELRTQLADQRKGVQDAQDQAKRFERAAELAEREMRFLRAMLVSILSHCLKPDPDAISLISRLRMSRSILRKRVRTPAWIQVHEAYRWQT